MFEFKDKNGKPLERGDLVLIPCRIVGTTAHENYGNLTLETVEPYHPSVKPKQFSVNHRQVVKVEQVEAFLASAELAGAIPAALAEAISDASQAVGQAIENATENGQVGAATATATAAWPAESPAPAPSDSTAPPPVAEAATSVDVGNLAKDRLRKK